MTQAASTIESALAYRRPGRQRGTVLVVALVLLLVLTMLGVAALNMNTVEERMSANTQEVMRGFQAAEAGLSAAFYNPNAFDVSNPFNGKTPLFSAGNWSAGANYTTTFIGTSEPPVGSLYSASRFSAFHFDTQSTGFNDATDPGGAAQLQPGGNAAAVALDGGAFQIGPRF